jgi:hypothetical protein
MLKLDRSYRSIFLSFSFFLALITIVALPGSADAKNYKLKIGCLESPDGPNCKVLH